MQKEKYIIATLDIAGEVCIDGQYLETVRAST